MSRRMQITDTVTLIPNQGWDSRILVCRCGTLVDTFVVVTERYVVLIDTLINGPTAAALLEIARPHLPGRQLLAVNTHADWDHAWGNQLFAGPHAAHPAPIVASRRCAERLRSEEARRKLAGPLRRRGADAANCAVRRAARDRRRRPDAGAVRHPRPPARPHFGFHPRDTYAAARRCGRAAVPVRRVGRGAASNARVAGVHGR